MENRFHELAMLKLAGRASEEESTELVDLLAEHPEFGAEYELMQKEIPAIKELIPMMKTPVNSDEVMPEYSKTALLSEIREMFGNEDHSPHDDQTEVYPDPIFWKWGFGLACLTLIVAVGMLWSQNSDEKRLDRKNRLLIGKLESAKKDLSESLTAREKTSDDLEKSEEGTRQLTQQLESVKKELSESLTARENASDALEKLEEGTRQLTRQLELAKKELSESGAVSEMAKYHITQLEKQSQVLVQRLELAMGGTTATALKTIYIGEVVQFTNQTEGPPGLKWEWDFGDGSPKSSAKEPSYRYNTPGNYMATLSVTTPNGGKLQEELWIKVLPPAPDKPEAPPVDIAAKPDNPWPGQMVAFTILAKDVEKVTWIIDDKLVEAVSDKNFAVNYAFDTTGQHDVKVEITRKGIKERIIAIVTVVVRGVEPKVEVLNEGPTYIGQPIKLEITNAASAKGAEQFPPGYRSELIDDKGNKLNPAKLFFAKPGLHQIKVLVTLPGVKTPFESELAKIDVKKIKIGIDFTPMK